MNSYYLPGGLLLAFIIAWFAPEAGAILQEIGLIPWMVVTIFLINGYQTQLNAMPLSGRIWTTALIAVVINLILSPFLGLLTATLLALPTGAAIGIIVTATVPSTLSSGIVMTHLAGGDSAKALFLTILLNLLGVFTIPFMLPVVLENVGSIELSPWPLLKQLMIIVLIPFIIGMLGRRTLQISPKHVIIRYLPSTCVIATVWMSVSASSETLKEISLTLIGIIIFGAILLHAVLLLLCLGSRIFNPSDRGEWIALMFTASQKTLPVAVGVLAALNQPIGVALVACILFHFLQLFVDSILAARLAKSGDLSI
ncbi:bile acid:sodium symporter [Sedimenticola selenatireducens]|uniref:Bile acid:sodium symporter n=1 Tax=Sedimenticola selenatireducens TaxID=191960 RepID=A0A557S7S8_9GAMM|nr:bile acid:sodium symporter [Sedimenticola selenatireducens]TVO73437.1 bile acid:sodium symporter [Sedimenticola selenatireducens]TVT63378.1 MAG: bile acid:sodium symporter [Sedimenticola selenatireducens]